MPCVQAQAGSALSRSKKDASRMRTVMYLQILDSLAGLLSVHRCHTAGVPAACQPDMLSRQAIPENTSCESQQGVTMVI